MVSPFMAGVSGFLRRRKEARDAQALRLHDINKINAEVTATYNAKNALIPKFQVLSPDGKTRENVLDENGHTIDFDLNKDSNEFDIAQAGLKMERIYNMYWPTWNETQQADFATQLNTIQRLYTKKMDVISDGKVFAQVNIPNFMKLQLGSGTSGMPVQDSNIKEEIHIEDPEGNSIDITRARDYTEDEKRYLPSARAAATLLIGKQDIFKLPKEFEGNAEKKNQLIDKIIAANGVKVLDTVYKLKDTGLDVAVSHQYVSNDQFDFIEAEAAAHYGAGPEAAEKRFEHMYKVLRAVSDDSHETIRGNWSVESIKEPVVSRAEELGIDREEYQNTARYTEEGLLSVNNLLANHDSWVNTMGPDKAPPYGIFGKWAGVVANAVDSKFGKGHAQAIIQGFKTGLGITTIVGEENLEQRLEENFKKYTEGKNPNDEQGRTYLESVGYFRATYEVYTELLAYQLASALQGGTGGKTISDQDVLNIKRALGEAIFVGGQFQVHRLREIKKFLSIMHMKNKYLGTDEATSVGKLEAGLAFRKYVYKKALTEQFDIPQGTLGPTKSFRNSTSALLIPGTLSHAAVDLLNKMYIKADAQADHQQGDIHNPAAEYLVNQGDTDDTGGADSDSKRDPKKLVPWNNEKIPAHELEDIYWGTAVDDEFTRANIVEILGYVPKEKQEE